MPCKTLIDVESLPGYVEVTISALYPHGWIPVHRTDISGRAQFHPPIYSESHDVLLNIRVLHKRILRRSIVGHLIVNTHLLQSGNRFPVLDDKGEIVALVAVIQSSSHSVDSRSEEEEARIVLEVVYDPIHPRHAAGTVNLLDSHTYLPRFTVASNESASDRDKDYVVTGSVVPVNVVQDVLRSGVCQMHQGENITVHVPEN